MLSGYSLSRKFSWGTKAPNYKAQANPPFPALHPPHTPPTFLIRTWACPRPSNRLPPLPGLLQATRTRLRSILPSTPRSRTNLTAFPLLTHILLYLHTTPRASRWPKAADSAPTHTTVPVVIPPTRIIAPSRGAHTTIAMSRGIVPAPPLVNVLDRLRPPPSRPRTRSSRLRAAFRCARRGRVGRWSARLRRSPRPSGTRIKITLDRR